MEYGSLLTLGTKRVTFSIPENVTPPVVSIGRSIVVPIVDVRYTLTEWKWNGSSRKLVIEIKIEDNDKESIGTESNAPNQSWQPNVRTVGGYVKQEIAYAPNMNIRVSPDMQLSGPEGIVVAVPVVLGALAALIGLGLVYLTVDKIEDVAESPSVAIFIVAIAALIFFMIYKQLKTA